MISDDRLRIVLGAHELNEVVPSEEGLDIAFKIVHKDWDPLGIGFTGDIAILRLDKQVEISYSITPVCLAKNQEELLMIREIKSGVVYGWGLYDDNNTHANIPLFAHYTISDLKKCEKEEPNIASVVWEKSFCVGKVINAPCSGDSGSGFLVKFKKKIFLRGIVSSTADENCTENKIVVYSDVTKYQEFIEDMSNLPFFEVGAMVKMDKNEIIINDIPFYSEKKIITKIKTIGAQINNSFIDSMKLKEFFNFLPGLVESTFSNLKKLEIFGTEKYWLNRIKTVNISRINLRSFKNIKELRFGPMDILNIERDSFFDLKRLEKAIFFKVYWPIDFIISECLANSKALKMLWFESNDIKILPKFPISNKKIEELSFHDNLIEVVPELFLKNLKNIKYLSLCANKISQLSPIFFSNIPSVAIINLSFNQLVDIPNGMFNQNQKLEILYLIENNISKIEQNFENLQMLKTIYLEGNECISENFYSREKIVESSKKILIKCKNIIKNKN